MKALAVLLGTPLVALLALSSCGTPKSSVARVLEEWNTDNAPSWFDEQLVTRFSDLPTRGNIGYEPWSSNSWSSHKGGIAKRWQQNGSNAWEYPLRSLDELRSLSYDELAKLSPSEKYDIFSNDYNYTLTKSERARVTPHDPGWWGICHGLAPASLYFPEPKPALLTNAAGITIPFGTADIEALYTLLHATANPDVANWRYIGVRCDANRDDDAALESDACRDSNAGAFHIALTNEVGIHKRGFILDRTRSEVIWNRPVFAFRTSVTGEQAPSAHAAPGTVRELKVTTQVDVVTSGDPHWDAGHQASTTENYKYILELNADGEIIGGKWTSWDRPDFLWKPLNTRMEDYMTGNFAQMKSLVAALATAPTAPAPGTGGISSRPTPAPTPLATPAPQPTTLDTAEEAVTVGQGEVSFPISVRRVHTYTALEPLSWAGTAPRLVQKVAVLNGSQVVNETYTNVVSGKFLLYFKLPAGDYRLTVQGLDGNRNVVASGMVDVKVIPY